MAHVIIDTCTKCASCADACPSDCIHPKQGEADFEQVSQLYINPDECLDCGACVAICPSNSIFPVEELPPQEKSNCAEKNASFFGQTTKVTK